MKNEMTKIMVWKKVKISISLLVCFKMLNSYLISFSTSKYEFSDLYLKKSFFFGDLRALRNRKL